MPRRTKKLKRRTRKGGFYGFQGGIPGTPGGAPDWRAGSEMGGFSLTNRGGNGQIGRGRKKRRTLRGGQKFGATYAAYAGKGTNGMIDVSAGTHKPGGAALGAFNNFGGFK